MALPKRVKSRAGTFGWKLPGAPSTIVPVLDYENFSAELEYTDENPQGADAGFVQRVLDLKDMTGSLDVFMGTAHCPAGTLPEYGDELVGFSFKLGADEVMPDDIVTAITGSKIRVVKVSPKLSTKAGAYTIQFKGGFID